MSLPGVAPPKPIPLKERAALVFVERARLDVKDVFPARAGMNRRFPSNECARMCVPRPCGDEPGHGSCWTALSVCSPPVRG